jgi:hypothetical protein
LCSLATCLRRSMRARPSGRSWRRRASKPTAEFIFNVLCIDLWIFLFAILCNWFYM